MPNSDSAQGKFPVTTFLLYGPLIGALTIYIPTILIAINAGRADFFESGQPNQPEGILIPGMVLVCMVIAGYILGGIPAALTALMIERYKKQLGGTRLYLFSGAMGYATIFLIGVIITLPASFLVLLMELGGTPKILAAGLGSAFLAGFLGIIPGFVCSYITYHPKKPNKKKRRKCWLNRAIYKV